MKNTFLFGPLTGYHGQFETNHSTDPESVPREIQRTDMLGLCYQ